MKKVENFYKALANLQKIRMVDEPYDIISLTGIIGLFEICYELSWKAMKYLLEYAGRQEQKTGSPRLIIKLAYDAGIIEDEQGWLELLETRNILAHTYNEENALESITKIKNNYLLLFEQLKKEIDANWLPAMGQHGE